ncbi:MAG: T9SS type A sorting domain-containing protein [Flavobacteriales bacterium]|jgi:hypothetical protein|nr:T9SS type A sorting domain-containing protein [Flavobacteriales bacterium]
MRISCALLVFSITAAATAQWSQVNNGISNLANGAYTLGASDSHVFAKTLTALYRSADNGDNWEEIDPPIANNTTECGAFFNGRYYAGLNASTACIHYTDDNGDSWTEAPGAPSATVVRGFLDYGGALYAYTSNAGIYRTLDGTNWAAVNNGLTSLNVIGMSAAGPYFLAATIGAGVFRTINASSWTQATGIAPGDLNGENTWRMGNFQYYTAQGGALYRSSDFGASYASFTAFPQFGLGVVEIKRYGSSLYMESRHFAGGGLRDSLYRSTNEGADWTNITGNLNAADLNGSGILASDGYLFIGYSINSPGQGLYRYAISTGASTIVGQQQPSVFPNPTTGAISIRLPIGIVSPLCTLFNAQGALVASSRASSTQQMDLSELPAGCYTLRWDDARLPPVRLLKQ